MHNVYLGLGSNQGDREEYIRKAISLIGERVGEVLRQSSLIETEPWGFQSENKFLNGVILVATALTPREVLQATQKIERTLGRDEKPEYDADGHRVYHNRSIDIDILFYGTEHIDTEDLVVPHPLIGERDFVKIPLAEIAKPSLRSAFPEYFM